MDKDIADFEPHGGLRADPYVIGDPIMEQCPADKVVVIAVEGASVKILSE